MVLFLVLIWPLKWLLGIAVGYLPQIPPDLCSYLPCAAVTAVVEPAIWILASILATFFAFIIVIVGTGVSQWQISQESYYLLKAKKDGIVDDGSSPKRHEFSAMNAFGSETFRQCVFFFGLLFWGIVSLFALFVPVLWIIPTIGVAWIFGYIVLDAVLEGAGMPFGKRFTKSLLRPDAFLPFGLSISFLLSFPLLALILFPAAAAGAGWLVVELELATAQALADNPDSARR
jgi:uncharacterized protein involved in cysteine biosynthesis